MGIYGKRWKADLFFALYKEESQSELPGSSLPNLALVLWRNGHGQGERREPGE